MRLQVILGLITVMVAGVSLAGCHKKGGQAVVLEKEYIAAQEIKASPSAEESVNPSSPTPDPAVVVLQEEESTVELAEDEIVVDTYVMKKDARGTSRDPRAMKDEQWIVRVRMVADLRRIKVQTDKAHWDKAKIGDRINVSYREGKYTGTVWAAEID
jgi:hypothetical protein